ncbi:MAG: DUF2007 domain-containing protein [Bacteroidetes bacterium]|nr:DUF2007 domain-containing protein [Bacteroidota bacterium]
MDKDWVKIYSTNNTTEAGLIKLTLEQNEIGCVIINKMDSIYIVIGEIELYVKKDHAVIALNIIEKELE